MPDGYVDVYEAAEELNISRMTLYRLMEQYGLKKYKFPGNRRTHIKRDDLDRLKEPQEIEGKPAA